MSIDRPPTGHTRVHRLRRHQFLTLHPARGLCLRAERGTLWVTIDGDRTDIELEPGQSRLFTGRAKVIVGTMGGDAVASLTTVTAPSPRRGWLDWLDGLLGARRPAAAADLTRAALP